MFAVEGVSISQSKVHIGIVLAAKDAALVGQVAVACCHAESYRKSLVVVVFVVVSSYFPCFAAYDTIEALYRIDQCPCQFPQETAESMSTVVEHQCTHTVRYFADSNTS